MPVTFIVGLCGMTSRKSAEFTYYSECSIMHCLTSTSAAHGVKWLHQSTEQTRAAPRNVHFVGASSVRSGKVAM